MTKTLRRVRDATPFSKVVPLSEANVARLGLVCVQERIPEDYTHWKISYALEGREGEISCECGSEYGGVPHGVDGDFATALNMLYLEQGTPASGLVETTAYQLIRYAGFEDSGYYYVRLSESLKRLGAAQYKVARVWQGGRGWQTTEFSYLNQIDSSSPEGRTVGRATLLSIRLAGSGGALDPQQPPDGHGPPIPDLAQPSHHPGALSAAQCGAPGW